MIKHLIVISIGIVYILAGIFRWHPVLGFLAWKYRPKTNKGVMITRIVSVLLGILWIVTYLISEF